MVHRHEEEEEVVNQVEVEIEVEVVVEVVEEEVEVDHHQDDQSLRVDWDEKCRKRRDIWFGIYLSLLYADSQVRAKGFGRR